jgi:hypothetical protein
MQSDVMFPGPIEVLPQASTDRSSMISYTTTTDQITSITSP